MVTHREGGLLAWQYRGYAERHVDKLNLWVHLYTVAAFIASAAAAFAHLLSLQWFGVLVSLGVMAAALGLQALVGRREALSAPPFDGPVDALRRVFAEQFVTFPRFVLSGGWMRNVTRRPEHY